MRPRDVLLLIGTLGLALGVGLQLMSSESLAVELPPGAPAVETPATTDAPPPAPTHPTPPPREPTDDDGPIVSTVRTVDAAHEAKKLTAGIVRGDVRIAVAILDKIQSITVVVEEQRNPIGPDNTFRHPWKTFVKVEMGVGTPTFEVRDIPFSDYPYLVSLYSPGLNSGERTVKIDAEHPLYDDIVLTLLPGAPFSVLVRDQDQNVYPRVDVLMQPVGDPAGRPLLRGTTDNFGSVVFENVLKGDYQASAIENGVPIGQPQVVRVQADGRMYGPKVQGQGFVLTLERGVPLEVEVTSNGYGIADALVQLQASDRVQLKQLELPTGYNGRAMFPHLPPGLWQIEVVKDGYTRRTKQITVKANEPPPLERFDVVRLR